MKTVQVNMMIEPELWRRFKALVFYRYGVNSPIKLGEIITEWMDKEERDFKRTT